MELVDAEKLEIPEISKLKKRRNPCFILFLCSDYRTCLSTEAQENSPLKATISIV